MTRKETYRTRPKQGADLSEQERSIFTFLWFNPFSTREDMAKHLYIESSEPGKNSIDGFLKRICNKLGPSTLIVEKRSNPRFRRQRKAFAIRSQQITEMRKHGVSSISMLP